MLKKILITTLLIILLGGAFYWFEKTLNKTTTETSINTEKETENKEVKQDDWIQYVSSQEDWGNKISVAFSYPPTWDLKEEFVTVFKGQPREYRRLDRVVVSGDGYSITVHQRGREMGRPYDYLTKISSYDARTWQTDLDGGYVFNFGINEVGFNIDIITPNKDKELLDRFLSTIEFI